MGLSVGRPAARRACCQRRFKARPPSMHASEEPIVEVPESRLRPPKKALDEIMESLK